MKKIIAIAALALAIPAAAFAAANPFAPPKHFVSPHRLNCNPGGIITDMIVTPKTGAKVAMSTMRWTTRRYAMTCGKPTSVKIVVTNNSK